MSVSRPTMGHPHIIVSGPPYVSPVLNVVVRPVSTDTMEKVTEKLAMALHKKQFYLFL